MADAHMLQILWGLNTLLIIVIGFLGKNWMNGISKKLGCKQDKVVCDERFPILQSNNDKLFTHRHPLAEGSSETGGVVIP